MDVTPAIPSGRQVVERYGKRRFRVSGEVYQGSILVFPDRTLIWAVPRFADLTLASLEPVLERGGREVDLLLLGAGATIVLPAHELRAQIRARGIVMEVMDTGAACRTYNVLVAEERRVAAALIAVD